MKKIFTLLAASVLTLGAWADTVQLNPGNISAAETGKTTFKSGYLFTNTSSKNTGSGNSASDGNKYIKFSNGVVYTIVIPENRQVTSVSISGGARGTTEGGYIAELNSQAFGSTDYVIPANLEKGTGVVAAKYDFTFETPAKGSITFKHAGGSGEALFNFVLTDEEKSDEVSESGLAWSIDNLKYKIRDNVEAPTFLNPNSLPVTFKTTDATIAAVDENGVVTLKNDKVGTAKISATFAGNDDYPKEVIELTVDVVTNEVDVKQVKPGVEPAIFDLDKMFYANDTSYPEGEIFADENITISTNSPSAGNTTYVKNYGGYEFKGTIQVRVLNEPTDDNPYGEEYGDKDADKTTSLKIVPNVDLTLYVYGRRQVNEDPSLREYSDDTDKNIVTVNKYYMFYPNDGKALKFNHIHENPSETVEKNSYLGVWDGYEYMYGISEVELEAGHEYNVYATGTTYQINGIGYIVKNNDENYVRRTGHVIEFKEKAQSQTDAAGYTLSRTGGNNLSSGNKIAVDGTEYTSVTFKGIITGEQQITYTVAAPKGKVVTKATIYAYTQATEETPYFSKVGNLTFADGTSTSITSKDTSNPDIISFDHIMLNTFDIEIHSGTGSYENTCVVIDLEVIDEVHNPAMPTVIVNNIERKHLDKISGEEVAVKVTAADPSHEIYYKHVYTTQNNSLPSRAMDEAVAVAETDIHEGYTKAENGIIPVPADGSFTTTVYAYDPVKNLKSAPTTITFSEVTTGIDVIAAEAAEAEVEYYNLQGIRVANPENGIFIRKQGSTVTKVVIR